MTLRLDSQVQRRVMLAGAFALGVGTAIILHLSLPVSVRTVLLLGWIALQFGEIYRFAVAAGGWRKLSISGSDGIRGLTSAGTWQPLNLDAGTFFTARFAWLRLRSGQGESFCTLLLASRMTNCQWRRLQVVLRLT